MPPEDGRSTPKADKGGNGELDSGCAKIRKGVHGGESGSTGAAVSELSCHCLPGHWGWKRRPFYVFYTP